MFGLVDLDFSPARLLAGLHQLGWITLMMIPPDPGASLPLYLMALGETLSIALLGTTHRRRGWRCRSACWRREYRALQHLPLSGAPVPRFDPRRRYADLGAGLDQRRRSRSLCRRAGDCGVGFRRVRQAVLRGDRGRRPEAGRGYPRVRRQCAARNPLWPDAAGAARDRRAGALFHRVRIRARRPSSASSAPAASACSSPSRSACWNGRKSRS